MLTIKEGFVFLLRRILPIWAYVLVGILFTLLLTLLFLIPISMIFQAELQANNEALTGYLQDLYARLLGGGGINSLPEFPTLEAGWVYPLTFVLLFLSFLFFDNWLLTLVKEMVYGGRSVLIGVFRNLGTNYLKRVGIGIIEGIVYFLFIILWFSIQGLGLANGSVSLTGATLLGMTLPVFYLFFLLFQIHVKIVMYVEKKGIISSYKAAGRIYKRKLDAVGRNLLQTVGGYFLGIGFVGLLTFIVGLIFSNQNTFADLILLLFFFPFLLFLSQLYFFLGYQHEIRPLVTAAKSPSVTESASNAKMEQAPVSYGQRIKPLQSDRNASSAPIHSSEVVAGPAPEHPADRTPESVAAPAPGYPVDHTPESVAAPTPVTEEKRINAAQKAAEGPIIAAGKVVCPSCGATVKAGKYCGQCGSPLQTDIQA